MNIRGWQKVSTIDFPGHIATVVFVGGCNFRCPMCHNGALASDDADLPRYTPGVVLDYLEERAGKIAGIVITGGEPTLQPDLLDFIGKCRARNVAVKLDTNGYRPADLRVLLEAGMLDYVAMDVKAPPSKYATLAGVDVDTDRINESIALLINAEVEREFRTTVVPELLDGNDIAEIAQWIAGFIQPHHRPPHYALQQFSPDHALDPGLRNREPYDAASLRAMRHMAARHLPISRIAIRGI